MAGDLDLVISEFLDEDALGEIPDHVNYHYDPQLVHRRDELCALIGLARALVVRGYVQVDAALLDAGPKLKVIGRLGVGLDNFDLPLCAQRGVEVITARGMNAVSVGEYAVTTAMMLLRGAYRANQDMMAGQWPRSALIGHEIAGRQFGIIGYGSTGQAAGRVAAGLGMQVAACDPYLDGDDAAWQRAEAMDFAGVLKTSDIVSLHVPLTGETRHMINDGALGLMKPGAALINAARGGVVDEVALARALVNGTIAGAAVDVHEAEPLEAERAALYQGLGNIILTPHIAGITVEANRRTSIYTVQSVVKRLLALS